MQGNAEASRSSDEFGHKYDCCRCKALVTEPMQTECGHLYCSSCLDSLEATETGQTRCLVDNSIITKVFPDNFVKKEILGYSKLIDKAKNEEHVQESHVPQLEMLPIQMPHAPQGLVPRNLNSMIGEHSSSPCRPKEECVGTSGGMTIMGLVNRMTDLENENRCLKAQVEQMKKLLEAVLKASRQVERKPKEIPVHGYPGAGDEVEACCPFKRWGCDPHLQPMPWPALQAHLHESTASHLELMRVEMTQHVATREEVDWCASDTKEAIAQQLTGLKLEQASIESAKEEIDGVKEQQERVGQRLGELERRVETHEHVLAVQNMALAGMRPDGRDDNDEGFVDDDEWWMWCGP